MHGRHVLTPTYSEYFIQMYLVKEKFMSTAYRLQYINV